MLPLAPNHFSSHTDSRERRTEIISTIEGKVVAITGASSGIGEAAARLLAERGAKVVVGARRSERLEKLVAAIPAKNGEARFRTLDVTSREDMQAFMGPREQCGHYAAVADDSA